VRLITSTEKLLSTTQLQTGTDVKFEWAAGNIHFTFSATADQPVSVAFNSHSQSEAESPDSAEHHGRDVRQPLLDQPFVELTTAGRGRSRSSERSIESMVGRALRYANHSSTTEGEWETLTVTQVAGSFGLQVESVLRSRLGYAGIQAWNTVVNLSDDEITLFSVSSFVVAPSSKLLPPSTSQIAWARNEWIAEDRWTVESLRASELPDLGLAAHGQDPRGSMSRSSSGSWSTGRFLPTGVVFDPESGWSLGWQVETNAPWTWEIGERRQGLYLAASGPSDQNHQWRHSLQPGESFDSVRAGFVVSDNGLNGALAALTDYRRAIRRVHPDNENLPVIYNDYMNTLDGKPSTVALIPLIDAASAVGVDVFVIDAGWYSDSDDWWDVVGEWAPATRRFEPGGLGRVIDYIRDKGMKAGLWMEPESVGIRSPVASTLPSAAFVQRDGKATVEHSRLHLDLRNSEAVEHLNKAVDRLVADFGIDYFKLDYNISAGTGSDYLSDSVSDALLEMGRAQIGWIQSLHARHPELTLENCASGAMRADYAELAEFQVQSTSDQQNFELYAAIAASSLASIAPEQSASWAYPQPSMTDEEIVFCLVNGLMGRMYLSGFLDEMNEHQLGIVREAVALSKSMRGLVRNGFPFWPLGLPRWTDDVVSVALDEEGSCTVAVWSRHSDNREIKLNIGQFVDHDVTVTQIFPSEVRLWRNSWDSVAGVLTVTPGDEHLSARVFSIKKNA
jgi:alpha-galactosidase